jgi:hypothetical protein
MLQGGIFLGIYSELNADVRGEGELETRWLAQRTEDGWDVGEYLVEEAGEGWRVFCSTESEKAARYVVERLNALETIREQLKECQDANRFCQDVGELLGVELLV